MTIHVCTFCRGFFYGYPESTRYCYACKASTVMPVDVVEYNFDYSGSMSKASTSGPIFDDRVKDHGKKVSPRSGAMPKVTEEGDESGIIRG